MMYRPRTLCQLNDVLSETNYWPNVELYARYASVNKSNGQKE